MKSVELKGWEPITDCPPSDNFICTYGGNFSQHLLINRGQIERFLDIASLDGRVLLQESKVRRPQPIPDGVNPDGSVAGRGSLRWGQKIEAENKKQNPYFQVESDPAGWVISINGNLIQEDLVKKGLDARNMVRPFAGKMNYYTRVGLRETLLKQKLSIPSLLSGGIDMVIWQTMYKIFIVDRSIAYVNDLLILIPAMAITNCISNKTIKTRTDYLNKRDSVIPSPLRKTLKSRLDYLMFNLEIDRVAIAYSYLDYQKFFGSSLIRMAD